MRPIVAIKPKLYFPELSVQIKKFLKGFILILKCGNVLPAYWFLRTLLILDKSTWLFWNYILGPTQGPCRLNRLWIGPVVRGTSL